MAKTKIPLKIISRKTEVKKSLNTDVAAVNLCGKQYLVREGQFIEVDKIKTKEKTQNIPDLLSDKKVHIKIIGEVKKPKIIILKFKNKTRYKRFKGFRPVKTKILVEKIA